MKVRVNTSVNPTSQVASLSEIFWMGAFLPSASSTSLMIWPKTVSVPTLLVLTSKFPLSLIVPA